MSQSFTKKNKGSQRSYIAKLRQGEQSCTKGGFSQVPEPELHTDICDLLHSSQICADIF